jgi:hypothetical protein
MLREELRMLHAEIRETFSKSAFPLPFVPAPEVQATADDECFSEHVPQFAWDTTTSTSCIDESVPPPPFVPTPEVKVVDDDEHRLFTDGTEAVACATTVSDVAPNERGLTTDSSPRAWHPRRQHSGLQPHPRVACHRQQPHHQVITATAVIPVWIRPNASRSRSMRTVECRSCRRCSPSGSAQ